MAGAVNGLGFVGGTLPNEIYANSDRRATSRHDAESARFRQHHGRHRQRRLGGNDLEHANVIEGNDDRRRTSPARSSSTASPATRSGIAAASGQLIAHNLIYRNTQTGVSVSGSTDVRIFNNTFYAPAGDRSASTPRPSKSRFATTSCGPRAATTSTSPTTARAGFFSDYNDLHATRHRQAGLLDARFHGHSRLAGGRRTSSICTRSAARSVNPVWSQPRFAEPGTERLPHLRPDGPPAVHQPDDRPRRPAGGPGAAGDVSKPADQSRL